MTELRAAAQALLDECDIIRAQPDGRHLRPHPDTLADLRAALGASPPPPDLDRLRRIEEAAQRFVDMRDALGKVTPGVYADLRAALAFQPPSTPREP